MKAIWTNEAKREMQAIVEFYNFRNGNNSYSSFLISSIKDSISLLKKYPYMYPATAKTPDTRYFICEYFKIFYGVDFDNHVIYIKSVFDCRRDPSSAKFQ